MSERKQILICLAFSILGFILERSGLNILSGIVMSAGAAALYMIQYIKTRHLFNLPGLFSLFFIGGEAVACFKLSKLSAPHWSVVTWVSIFLAYAGFMLGYSFIMQKKTPKSKLLGRLTEYTRRSIDEKVCEKRLFFCICAVCIVSAACFIFEAVWLGFIPFFSEEPHAYSYFHISGVHYFTVTCVMVLPLTFIYLWNNRKSGVAKLVVLAIVNFIAISIPILCVSRFQLMLSILLAMCVYASLNKNFKWYYVIGVCAALVPLYVILTVARNHDVAYLNSIFEMKNSNMPIFITQPYMYVANNYENFNCLVEQLTEHTYGLRQLFPVFALTGLKFVFPQLVSFPLYITKEELTTVSLIYDAYYDFGIIGVAVFGLILGCACGALQRITAKSANPIAYLFYGQIAMYLVFSFFTTWFSNPTTWFWLVITLILYVYVGRRAKSSN